MSQFASLSQLSQSLTRDEKFDLAMELLTALKGGQPMAASSKAPKAPKVAAEPDAPKKEPSWWMKATQHVRAVLKPSIEAYNAALGKDGKKMAGTAPVVIASMLKASGLLSAESPEASDEDIMEAFAAYKASPPEPKEKKATSEASAGSKASKTKFSELSDEEQKVMRSERAKKAAATRAANKASKAPAAPAPEADSNVDMPWIHNGKAYLKIDNCLWDAATDAWIGAWDPVKKMIDPFAEEPEREEA